MPLCLSASDLHGRADRYHKLFGVIDSKRPSAVFLAGDLLSFGGVVSARSDEQNAFLDAFPFDRFEALKKTMGADYPEIFVVLGNDDPRSEEPAFIEASDRGVLTYMQERHVAWAGHDIFGYAFVPPTPFRLKDWERYDVSRYVDPGCVSPEEGVLSIPRSQHDRKHATIKADLDRITSGADLSSAIILFHSPPYRTALDRAALDSMSIDHAPVDCHVGSIAVRRFIEARQPLLTLHGHVHESARLTGSWREQIGRTWCFSAAHDGPELALISFNPSNLADADRQLI